EARITFEGSCHRLLEGQAEQPQSQFTKEGFGFGARSANVVDSPSPLDGIDPVPIWVIRIHPPQLSPGSFGQPVVNRLGLKFVTYDYQVVPELGTYETAVQLQSVFDFLRREYHAPGQVAVELDNSDRLVR